MPAKTTPAETTPATPAETTPTNGTGAVGEVLVRYFAAARAAAGVETDRLPAGLSVDDLVDRLAARHGDRLAKVFGVASFLVDGVSCQDRRAPLAAGTTVDVLPPFAGG